MEQINPTEKNFLTFKVSGALIFQVFGAVGVFYCIWKNNWNSAAWCLVLEICCVMVLIFNKNYVKGQLHVKHSAKFFQIMQYVTLVIAIGSCAAFIAYIAVGTVRKETFDMMSHYATAPIAFLAGFWSFVLFFDCRKFVRLLE